MKIKIDRMKELILQLREASRVYYAEDMELISNYEYDKLYDELLVLESETGMVLANSASVTIGYDSVEELPKEAHQKPMLSLDKTKEDVVLQTWIQDKVGLLSWKLDGLTVVLTYQDGKLLKAVTRGSGEVGEIITNNATVFQNIPIQIPYKGELVLRGEAIITYSDFEKINDQIPELESKYKNPRNLCSGSVRQLNNKVTANRYVKFYAFYLVQAENLEFENSREKQLLFLESNGFEVVEYKKVTADSILEEMRYFSDKIKDYNLPSDGLVLTFDDIDFGTALGATSKFPRDSIAFKWEDEIKETTLLEIEWSPSRTGLINPVAIFEPVELEGTTVSRASVHNVSIMETLELGVGDTIRVYKANMIIPQIADNDTRSNSIVIPNACPVCGEDTEIKQLNQVKVLFCNNSNCQVKKLKSFALLASRNALNIDGLSEATLEKLLEKKFLITYSDLFYLSRYKEEIVEMEGFGLKSYENLIDSIEKARQTTLPKMIYGLGIANIGLANAKMIGKEFDYSLEDMKKATVEQLNDIDGVGEVIAAGWQEYFSSEENTQLVEALHRELIIPHVEIKEENRTLNGINFVITGSLDKYQSRNELKEIIENKGGKVTGSVTSKTQFLINNDKLSNSSKNKKAKELEIMILSEEDFIEKFM